jgi:hypothetical protein
MIPGAAQLLQKEKKPSLQAEYEWNFIEKKRQNFDHMNCQAWRRLTARFGPKISQEELLSLAMAVAYELKLDLSREYKRRKELLVKWFDENLAVVWPFIEQKVVISDWKGDRVDTGRVFAADYVMS